MFTLKNFTIFFIVIIIVLLISILSINKVTIDNINNEIKLSDNVKNLKILLWLNYIFVMTVTIYLTYRLFTKIDIFNNLHVFIPNIFAIILNTTLTAYTETILNYPTQDKLNQIYITSSISTIVNILNIILLFYNVNLNNYTEQRLQLQQQLALQQLALQQRMIKNKENIDFMNQWKKQQIEFKKSQEAARKEAARKPERETARKLQEIENLKKNLQFGKQKLNSLSNEINKLVRASREETRAIGIKNKRIDFNENRNIREAERIVQAEKQKLKKSQEVVRATERLAQAAQEAQAATAQATQAAQIAAQATTQAVEAAKEAQIARTVEKLAEQAAEKAEAVTAKAAGNFGWVWDHIGWPNRK